MKANPTTFYEPQNRVLFDETTAEILTGATTYHSLQKEKQEELKKEFSERVLDYFDRINIAPTLDNLLLHQDKLRSIVSSQINQEIERENEDYEDILGLGKNAKAKREAKKSQKSDTFNTGGNWNKKKPDAGAGDYRNANASNGTKILKKPDAGTGNYQNANASNGTKNEKWNEMLKNGFGVVTQAAQVAQTIKQNNQQQTDQQQGFFPDPEPKKQKVLGMEPIVGIALILIILVVFAFLIWQISQNNSK